MQTPRYRAVFLSPHLDDAVFSCGGTMAKLVPEGPVLVLNVFSHYPANLRRGPVVIDQGRHAEEANAARTLGFSSDGLGEVDAALRHEAYTHPGNLFRPPVERDMQYLPALSARIRAYLNDIEYDALYLPLGVGWHVDHMLCHLATADLHDDPKVSFYEDAPYCLVPNFLTYRVHELGEIAGGHPDRPGKKRVFDEWYETSNYYTTMAPMRKIGPWPVRTGAVVVVSLYLWQLLARHRRLSSANCGPSSPALMPRVDDVTAYFSQKVDACYQYGSQIAEFFISREDCEYRYRQYSAAIRSESNAVVERFWQFGGASSVREK